MPFKKHQCYFEQVKLLEAEVFQDDRGYFKESFKQSDFESFGIYDTWVQDNISSSSKGVLRGLHFQDAPYEQSKLVQALEGKIWDVVVDIRKGSHSYLRWYGVELSQDNHRILYVPKGFAHGFLVLSKSAKIMYKCSGEYIPKSEGSLAWNDPLIDIDWPVKDPILSKKDASVPFLNAADL